MIPNPPLGIFFAILIAFGLAALVVHYSSQHSSPTQKVEDPIKWKVTDVITNDPMIHVHLLTDTNGQTFLVVRDGNGTAMLPYTPVIAK